MAGHKMSGYVASLWQALFASFIQLFNRLFPFGSTEKAPPKPTKWQEQEQQQQQRQRQQQQQEQQQEQQQQPTNTSTISTTSATSTTSTTRTTFATHATTFTTPITDTTDTTNTTQNENTDSSFLSSSSPHLHPSNSCPSHSLELHQNSPHSFIDLEQGLESSSPSSSSLSSPSDYHTMAPNKKRGRKRGGFKGNGNNNSNGNGPGNPGPDASSAPSNGPSNAITSQPTSSQSGVPSPASQDFGPARVTTPTSQGNTTANSHQPAGQQQAGAGRGGHNRLPSPQRPLANANRRGSVALPRNLNAPSTSHSASPALDSLVTDTEAQSQKSGTRSQHTTTARDPTQSKPRMAENIPPQRPAEGLDFHDSDSSADLTQLRRPIQTTAAPSAKTSLTTALPFHANKGALKSITAPVPALPSVPASVPAPALAPAPIPTPTPAPAPAPVQSPAPIPHHLPGLIEPKTEEERVEREHHLKFMREALAMGNTALGTNETPVGCVIVYHGRVIARGMNATNNTRNGTRHAEFMAISALLSRKGSDNVENVDNNPALDDARWGDVDPSDGHIFPYGQKLHPAPVVNREILSECILYVTVEPCVMCASLLRQLGIQKVYFGAVNDKFGGTGGVFKIHMNSKAVLKPLDRPYQNGYGPQDADRVAKGRAAPIPRDEDDGDGGNVERGYPVEGGYLRDDAVSLLRRFYVQENGRAPQPRKKEGRAARLYAMENQAKNGGNVSDGSDVIAEPEAQERMLGDMGDDLENIGDACCPADD